MGRIPKVSAELKLQAIQEFYDGKDSMTGIAKKYGVTLKPFRKWLAKYEVYGAEGFSNTRKNKCYCAELKRQVVLAYLNGEGSYIDIAKKFKVSNESQVNQWVLKYNSHEELKASKIGGTAIMTNGRKTTFDERVEIVQYCIAHNHNYAETSEKYQISYQQVRNYTVKYESGGVQALKDNRGKRKSEDQMTELDLLRAENKILRAEKERAEMEASFLKKLEEVERRRY